MGQAVHTMKYDRAANERTAIGALDFVDQAFWNGTDWMMASWEVRVSPPTHASRMEV
jgi:hypothetical protein